MQCVYGIEMCERWALCKRIDGEDIEEMENDCEDVDEIEDDCEEVDVVKDWFKS